jgi:excinuclease UvrABC ATPase subunit
MRRLTWIKKKALSVCSHVDRLSVREGITQRLTDSVETALKLAGVLEVKKMDTRISGSVPSTGKKRQTTGRYPGLQRAFCLQLLWHQSPGD